MDKHIYEAAQLQKTYEENYNTAAQATDYGNLPLVALAAAAVGALFYGADTDVIAGIGLGTGTYVAGRNIVAPPNMETLYIQGHGALACMIEEAQSFTDDRRRDSLAKLLNVLRDKKQEATDLSNSAVPPEQGVEAFQKAQTDLIKAIADADLAYNAGLGQLAAYILAPREMSKAIRTVRYAVASRARLNKVVGFTELRRDLTNALNAASVEVNKQVPSTEALTEAGAKSASMTERLNTASRQLKLTLMDIALVGADFEADLDRLRSCPSIIT
jgi:hypothetical protein